MLAIAEQRSLRAMRMRAAKLRAIARVASNAPLALAYAVGGLSATGLPAKLAAGTRVDGTAPCDTMGDDRMLVHGRKAPSD